MEIDDIDDIDDNVKPEMTGGSSGTASVSREEICDQALKHYEELASKCHCWFSVVPKAIKFYKEHGPETEGGAKEDTMKTVEMTFSLPEPLHENLQRVSRETGRSHVTFLKAALHHFIRLRHSEKDIIVRGYAKQEEKWSKEDD